MKRIRSILLLVTAFSIAMAFMESSVVIYLRKIIYPEGFTFPLNPLPGDLSLTECLRETATLIMLAAIGMIAGKTFSQRFAWFIFSFAIWDIFYYVFLKILINWPESVFSWDILFLIPVIWSGPVISPVIVSFTMILLAGVILNFAGKGVITRIIPREWGLLITGSAVIFVAFTWDFSMYTLRYYNIKEIITHSETKNLYQAAMSYVPSKFNWGILILGELVLLMTVVFYYRRLKILLSSHE